MLKSIIADTLVKRKRVCVEAHVNPNEKAIGQLSCFVAVFLSHVHSRLVSPSGAQLQTPSSWLHFYPLGLGSCDAVLAKRYVTCECRDPPPVPPLPPSPPPQWVTPVLTDNRPGPASSSRRCLPVNVRCLRWAARRLTCGAVSFDFATRATTASSDDQQTVEEEAAPPHLLLLLPPPLCTGDKLTR